MNKIINKLFLILVAASLTWGCTKEADGDGSGTPAGSDTYGYITDTSGAPVEGVVVSDGYSCTQTDAKGMYKFVRNSYAYYVYYSIPAGYQVNMGKNSGIPEFFTRLRTSVARYDFTLTPLTTPETKFRLVCIGDPQVNDTRNVARFNNETVADIRSYLAADPIPTYAITLGDLVNNKWILFPNMLSAMQKNKITVPVFQTIGNHDHNFDEAKTNIGAQRGYEGYFGPTNYSFDRGDVHIVSMDNVIHGCTQSDDYEGGFLEEQYNWLVADLSYVSKEKKVIFCAHIPFRGGSNSGGANMNKDKYYSETLALLAQFKSATIMSAHTHSNLNYIHNVSGKEIYEHITGTTCGAWWKSTVCTEGTPNGYAIYNIDGAAITKWIYKPTKLGADYQIRLYKGTDTFIGGTKSYQFTKKSPNMIVANIWNSDPAWKVEVFENNVKTGDMSRYTDRDAWTIAYHVGALGGSDSYDKTTDHLYYYTLTNPGSEVRVEATDRFGNKYTQSTFTAAGSTPAGY